MLCSNLQASAQRPEIRTDAQPAGDESDAFGDTVDNQSRILARSG